MERLRANTLVGHLSGMSGLVLIAVLVAVGMWAFANYGPWAAPTSGPLSAADKADLGPRYAALEKAHDDGLAAARDSLNTAMTNGDLTQIQNSFGTMYRIDQTFLDGINGINWRAATPEANNLKTTLQAELTKLDAARTIRSVNDVQTAFNDYQYAKTNVDVTRQKLRDKLGLPQPVVSPNPQASGSGPAASASAPPSASTVPSATPVDTSSPQASASQ